MSGIPLNIPKDVLEQLYVKQKLTAREVGQTMGIDRHTVCRHLKRHGLIRSKSEVLVLRWRGKRKLPEPREVEHLYWNKGLTISEIAQMFNVPQTDVWAYMKRYDISRKSISAAKKGKSISHNYQFKKGHLPWNKGQIGVMPSGHNHWLYRASFERRQKHIKALRDAALRGHYYVKPTKPERILIGLIKAKNLPYRYVGNGQFILGGKCPDFLNVDGKKQVIEVFGTYWHDLFDMAKRSEHFRQYGFDTLVIWEDELKNEETLLKRLRAFARKKVGAAQ